MDSDYSFDRPVIVVAAPRSGSTMLFESLSHAKNLWTIGGESHAVFEHINKLDPGYGMCATNRLTADDADNSTINQIRRVFHQRLRDRDGRLYGEVTERTRRPPRLLEKTPKNALRIPFLNQVFPDALYIYLYRDPRENMSSMIEAWRSLDFVTYTRLPDWPGDWSLLLPPGYEDLKGAPLEQIVSFQWQAANRFIIEDLGDMAADRWTAVSYAELLADAPATIERLCRFVDLPFDEHLKAHCEKELPLSRYTQSSPKAGKWRMNEAMIDRVMPGLEPLIASIDVAVAPYSSFRVLLSGPISEPRQITTTREDNQQKPVLGRNERCYCGSGLRYKHCHGGLNSTPDKTTGATG